MHVFRILVSVGFFIFFVGCGATTPIVPGSKTAYDQFKASDDNSLVYIVRKSKSVASLNESKHYVDGKAVGVLGNDDGLLVVALRPGKHTYGYQLLPQEHIGTREFQTNPGERKIITYEAVAIVDFGDYDQKLIADRKLGNFINIIDPGIAQRKEKQKEQAIAEARLADLQKQNIAHLNTLIRQNKQTEFMEFLDNYPGLAEHIEDPNYRLLLTGPKELRIGKIAKMLEKGFGDKIIVAKIHGVKYPYKDFSLDELEQLKAFGFSDDIVAAMMNVTTELNKEEERRARDEAFLAEQRRLAEEMQASKATMVQSEGSSAGNAFASGAGKAVGNAVGKEIGKALLDQLF